MPEKRISKSIPPQNLPTIDLSPQIHLEYLAEGAANILYRIVLPPPSPATSSDIDLDIAMSSPATTTSSHDSGIPSSSTTATTTDIQTQETDMPPLKTDPRFKGKLVRLRKATQTPIPVLDSHKFFKKMIAPSFSKSELVEQVLFRPTPALIRDCNTRLRAMEDEDGGRPDKRHGVYLDEGEGYGSLVTDMTKPMGGMWRCVEFKPKWLVQSPNAPVGSRRCRTCALRASKRARCLQVGEKGEKVAAAEFCPLNLVSLDRGRVAAVVNQILGPVPRFQRKTGNEFLSQFRNVGGQNGVTNGSDLSEGVIRERLVEFLYRNELLDALRRKQVVLDPVGVLRADVISLDFLAAMTLRDCTLFLRIPLFADGKIEARLGDLDLKSVKGEKAIYWKSVEKELIESGWYTATEKQATNVPGEAEIICQLS